MARGKQDNALVTSAKESADNLQSYLMERKGVVDEICEGALSSERLIHLAMGIGRRTPDLLQCSPGSWVTALLDAAFFGIEPNPQLGHAYLVPFKNKGRMEVQFIIGYKGYHLLAWQSSRIRMLPVVVYENDEFELRLENEWEGKAPFFHRPTLEDRGNLKLVYSTARFPDGGREFVWLPKTGKQSIDYYRDKSRAGQSEYSPWTTAYESMAKKTVIRRQAEQLPVQAGSKLGLVIKHENSFEQGDGYHAYRFNEKRGTVEKELAEEYREDQNGQTGF